MKLKNVKLMMKIRSNIYANDKKKKKKDETVTSFKKLKLS